jgi:hypothetical protein
MALNVRQCTEAVHLGLEEPVWVVEWLRDAEEAHWDQRWLSHELTELYSVG